MVQMELRDGHDSILADIEQLLAATSADGTGGELSTIEHALTSGYAHALALEAERWRLERQLGVLAADLSEEGADARVDELAQLARRMSAADGDLSRLRGLLAALRVRASALRSQDAALGEAPT